MPALETGMSHQTEQQWPRRREYKKQLMTGFCPQIRLKIQQVGDEWDNTSTSILWPLWTSSVSQVSLSSDTDSHKAYIIGFQCLVRSCDGLGTRPGCTPPLTQWLLDVDISSEKRGWRKWMIECFVNSNITLFVTFHIKLRIQSPSGMWRNKQL